jgi:predicted solute-binding protein
VNTPVRLGAVNYLNVRPLVYGLSGRPDVELRFDVPSECARLLDIGEIDLGMIPSIAYLDRPGDRIVPGVAIGSDGPVASVALYARRPMSDVRTIALDTSSRTSAVLVRILCRRVFGISPTFVPHPPDLPSMLARADAALLIGDAALFLDHRAFGARKWDLGQLWTDLTGLPFVWAFWSGRPDAAPPDTVAVLQAAAREGTRNLDEIARAYRPDDPPGQRTAITYLHSNMVYALGDRAIDGLQTYYREAAGIGIRGAARELVFFGAGSASSTGSTGSTGGRVQ